MSFFINSNIFRHLKLEIALAIPASNDEKYNWNNSAGQGLKAPSALFGLVHDHISTIFIDINIWRIAMPR